MAAGLIDRFYDVVILLGASKEGQRVDGHGAGLPEPGEHSRRGSASGCISCYVLVLACEVKCGIKLLWNWCSGVDRAGSW